MKSRPELTQNAAAWSEKILSAIGGLICIWGGAIACLKTVSWPLFFDEYLHSHFLWLISIGKIPHKDFWCQYPSLGYVVTLPYFKLLPESIYSVIALRFLVVSLLVAVAIRLFFHARNLGAHWVWGILPLIMLVMTQDVGSFVSEFRTDAYGALLAILALTAMFREPAPLRTGLVVALSVLSIIVMPKYIYPLFLANLAYIGYGCLKLKQVRNTLLSASAGLCGALLISSIALLIAGISLWDDMKWSPLFMQQYYSSLRNQSMPVGIGDQAQALSYFSQHWSVAVTILAGLVGWAVVMIKEKGVQLWVGTAVIAGVIVFWGTCLFPYRQYLVPGLLCLTIFTPYIASALKNAVLKNAAALLLLILTAQSVISYNQSVATELASGKSIYDFSMRQELLSLIPRTEKVMGFNETHPCFRENQTFVTWDEKAPGFTPAMPKDSQILNFFSPEHLAESLEKNPPASLGFPSTNYPPGWHSVIEDFLQRHADRYENVNFPLGIVFVRKDLLGAAKKNK